MIIDIHNHPDWEGHNIDKFLINMKLNKIDLTWLLSWEAPADEYDPGCNRSVPNFGDGGPIPFSRLLYYAERVPGKFILGYAPDPRKPGAIDRVNAAISTYGVRVYGELKLRMMYDNPDAIMMYRFCGEKNLPVLVHIDYDIDSGVSYPRPNWWYGGGIDAFERAIKRCPETIFIGHASGFWSHISANDSYDKVYYPSGKVVAGGKLIEMMRLYPNLYCDLSARSGYNALSRDHEYAVKFLLEFQDRIMFGRDNFDDDLRQLLNRLGLPADVLAKIYSGNALRLVPINDL
jgi:Predicted metal-dependent hydrolase of the TIM-barrel fold